MNKTSTPIKHTRFWRDPSIWLYWLTVGMIMAGIAYWIMTAEGRTARSRPDGATVDEMAR